MLTIQLSYANWYKLGVPNILVKWMCFFFAWSSFLGVDLNLWPTVTKTKIKIIKLFFTLVINYWNNASIRIMAGSTNLHCIDRRFIYTLSSCISSLTTRLYRRSYRQKSNRKFFWWSATDWYVYRTKFNVPRARTCARGKMPHHHIVNNV